MNRYYIVSWYSLEKVSEILVITVYKVDSDKKLTLYAFNHKKY